MPARAARRGRRSAAEALLREAGFQPRPMAEAGPPLGFELGPLTPGGPEAVAFDSPEGLTLGLKLPLPPRSESAGLAPTAERTLKLIGALTLGLQAQGMQVTPVARYQGLEALLLSVHLCRPLRGQQRVHEAFARLQRTAHVVGKALLEPPDRLLVSVRQAAGVRRVLAAPSPVRVVRAAVPAFDPQVARRLRHRRRPTAR